MGSQNYITPPGLEKLKAELSHLLHKERPELVKTVAWAASNGDRSENADYIYGKRRLREIDKRTFQLTRKIETALVVDPKTVVSDKIVFGATVVVSDEEGNPITFQIVGEDEIDVDHGKISWRSPVGSALLGKRVGDQITVRRPNGDWTVEIMSLEFR